MIKKTLDFKLINLALIMVVIFIVYNLSSLFATIINGFFSVTSPFIIAFVLAYAIEPLLNFLMKKKIPKNASILIIIVTLIAVFALVSALVLPVLFDQLTSLFNTIITFTKDLIDKNNLDLGPLQDTLNNSFNDILGSLGGVVSSGALGIINASMGILTGIFIVLSAMVYFLIDMKNIRARFKEYIYSKSKRSGNYMTLLDNQMKLYFTGFFRIILISITEYTLLYTIIGHPHALLIGFLAGLGNLIPVFGGLIVSLIALITAIVLGPALLIKTVIVILISSILDSYVINPLVYRKTNQVPPILILFAVFAGATLFGFVGVVVSIPVTIIIMSTYKYYKNEIDQKIEEVTNAKKNL